MGLLNNISQFRWTMKAFEQGGYSVQGEWKALSRKRADYELAYYYSESEVERLLGGEELWCNHYSDCSIKVTNEDSFACAEKLVGSDPGFNLGSMKELPPLVLNFANPHTPGGGVKTGASAQEEDLCRHSTLYASLTSSSADLFYGNNRLSGDRLFTHGVLISPCVEVFVNADGNPMVSPFEVSVMTVPAPYAKSLRAKDAELREVIRIRIAGMLRVAAHCGYSRLVLGAWGCGAFGNDPRWVAETFVGELRKITRESSPFSHVGFAVLDKSPSQKVFRVFSDAVAHWEEC